MRPPIYISTSVQFFIMVIGLETGFGKNTNGKNSYSYTYESTNYDSKDYGFNVPDYSYGGGDSATPVEYVCYSCTFHVRKGSAAGFDNCRDPFVKSGISEVPCQGACAKIYHKTSETEYTVTRTCLPECKDVKDDKGYTQCCYGRLCNGGWSLHTTPPHSQYLTLVLGVLFSSIMMALR